MLLLGFGSAVTQVACQHQLLGTDTQIPAEPLESQHSAVALLRQGKTERKKTVLKSTEQQRHAERRTRWEQLHQAALVAPSAESKGSSGMKSIGMHTVQVALRCTPIRTPSASASTGCTELLCMKCFTTACSWVLRLPNECLIPV